MPPISDTNMSVGQFAERYRREMIPLRKPFSYYFTALPLTEEDIREYLDEPIAALPPSVVSQLPKISILLVPYLEKTRERGAQPVGRDGQARQTLRRKVFLDVLCCFPKRKRCLRSQ